MWLPLPSSLHLIRRSVRFSAFVTKTGLSGIHPVSDITHQTGVCVCVNRRRRRQ